MLVFFTSKNPKIICFFELCFMQKIRRNIPNAITCGNLLCGCLAIVKIFNGDLVWAAYLVGIAAVLDFFDGFAARMLHVASPIGKDLDSLADMVTFGVVPGFMGYKLITDSLYVNNLIQIKDGIKDFNFGSLWEKANFDPGFLPYIAFIIPVFSAIRLAKFNNDARQTESFIGLPTPANAIFFCSIPLVLKQITDAYAADKNPFELLIDASSNPILALLGNYWVLIALMLVFSFMLIMQLPLFSLKFKSFGWKGNEIRFVFIVLSLALLGSLKFIGIPLIIIVYLLMSVVNNIVTKNKAVK